MSFQRMTFVTAHATQPRRDESRCSCAPSLTVSVGGPAFRCDAACACILSDNRRNAELRRVAPTCRSEPKGSPMATQVNAWNSHVWSNRLMDLMPGVPIVQHSCTICGRNFVNEELTGRRYAVHVGIVVLDRLSDEVTKRWLAERCPRARRESDYDDLKTRLTD
jgi:hypothetical protein